MPRCTVLLTMLLLALGVPSFAQFTPLTNMDPLTGMASAPVTVKKNTQFSYAVTGTDSDTYLLTIPLFPPAQVKLFDTTTILNPFQLRSMSLIYVATRGTQNFTRTFDVIGTSVATPDVYVDKLQVFNDGRLAGDILFDTPQAFEQTVIVTN